MLISETLHYIVMLLRIYDARIHLAFSHWLSQDFFIPRSDGD